MKLIGATVLTVSALALGIIKASELQSRVTALRELIGFLELLKSEICTRRTPLKQILSGSIGRSYRYILEFTDKLSQGLCALNTQSFSQLWAECADSSLRFLTSQQNAEVKQLGNMLGRYDAELQSTAIDRCIFSLRCEYEQYKEGLSNNKRMYIGLSTGAGLILAIVLL